MTSTNTATAAFVRDGMLMNDALVEVFLDYSTLSADEFATIIRSIDGLHQAICDVAVDPKWMPQLLVESLSTGSARIVFRQGLSLPTLEFPEEKLTLVLPRWAAVPYLMIVSALVIIPTVGGVLTIQEYLEKHGAGEHETVIKQDFDTKRLDSPHDPAAQAARTHLEALRLTLNHENMLRMELNGRVLMVKEREDTGEDRPRPPKVS